MNRLKDKVIVITDGNSGIGHATAILATQEGAAWARDAKRGHTVVQAMRL